jgi:hypothetical protein
MLSIMPYSRHITYVLNFGWHKINTRYNGLMGGGGSVIADVHYNRLNKYLRMHIRRYLTSLHNKHRITKYYYIKVFVFLSFWIDF